MDAVLRTHCIDPALLRANDFEGFFRERRATLLSMVERAMGKPAIIAPEPATEDGLGQDVDVYSPVEA
jgi:hypothetical protein